MIMDWQPTESWKEAVERNIEEHAKAVESVSNLTNQVATLQRKLHDLEQLLPHIEGYDYDA